MRTKITELDATHVEIEYDCVLVGERVSRSFYCGSGPGAYVFEDGHRQVCDALGHRGSTLMMGRCALVDVIRREYRAMRREEKRLDLR